MALGELGKVSAVLLLMGFFLDALVLSGMTGLAYEGKDGAVEGLEITGFICYVVAVLLALLAYYGGGDLKGNKIAVLITICFSFLAVVFIIAGLALYGDQVVNGNLDPYPATLFILSATLALVSGILSAINYKRNF